MNKVVMVLFGVLTLGAMGLSTSNFGVSGASAEKASPSVRTGSTRSGGGWFVGGGGSRGGK